MIDDVVNITQTLMKFKTVENRYKEIMKGNTLSQGLTTIFMKMKIGDKLKNMRITSSHTIEKGLISPIKRVQK